MFLNFKNVKHQGLYTVLIMNFYMNSQSYMISTHQMNVCDSVICDCVRHLSR